jgi:hypothetical protein
VVSTLAPKIAEFSAGCRKHYKIETGGMYEESQKSQASVFAVVPVMILLMMHHDGDAGELPPAGNGALRSCRWA